MNNYDILSLVEISIGETMSNQIDTNREHITTPQAAERAGLSANYIATLLRQGKLSGFQLAQGTDWFVYTDSLDLFLKAHRKPGPKGPRKKKDIV